MNILNYLDFVKEGLINTQSHEIVLRKVDFLPKHIIYNIRHTNSDNLIHFEILHFNKISDISNTFDAIESYFINMMGWFPSTMIIKNLSGMSNKMQYNKFFLLETMEFIDSVNINFESKFDTESKIPDKLYHLSIREFQKSILRYGIYPKSKSKISYHDSRIYVCKSILACKSLIPNMKSIYNYQKWKYPKSKINDNWVIYEIDTNNLDIKLFIDPNYIGGYYTTSNIPPDNVKIIDFEK